MHHVRQENLPFVGSSHEFVGAEQGDTNVSLLLFEGKLVLDRGRTDILTMKSKSSAKGEVCGR